MPTHETIRQRADRRSRGLLARVGHELYGARSAAALSSRHVGGLAGISHTQLLRIERGVAPHVDIGVLARVAAVVGCELSLGVHPVGPPVRDAAHLALLGRLRAAVPSTVRWTSEVAVPLPGDRRSADATLVGPLLRAMVEAETRLGDVQATERRISAKARDLGFDRVVLLVLDSRHNREVIRLTPELRRRFPIGTRAALAALRRGIDPGGDCLIVL